MAKSTDLPTHCGGRANNSLTNIIKNNNNNDNINIGDPELDSFTQSDCGDRDKLVYYLQKHISEFTISSLNVQSLHAKIDQLKILIYDLAHHYLYFDIICVQETWLFQDSNVDLIQLEHYKSLHKAKTSSELGGVGFYIYEDFAFTILPLLDNSKICDGIFVDISSKNHNLKLLIGNIYSLPRDLNDNYIHF